MARAGGRREGPGLSDNGLTAVAVVAVLAAMIALGWLLLR
jgi:hypothetical protein